MGYFQDRFNGNLNNFNNDDNNIPPEINIEDMQINFTYVDSQEVIGDYLNKLLEADSAEEVSQIVDELYNVAYSVGYKECVLEELESKMSLLNEIVHGDFEEE